jgi:hypothetical protein
MRTLVKGVDLEALRNCSQRGCRVFNAQTGSIGITQAESFSWTRRLNLGYDERQNRNQ